ncbi:hypothetical protein TRAPUB_11129 [Trametes pubescens]|uniref:F-box domain-containing protein n=1 Tax=Trametes pubescens TaxID=154538 RepID=A0A1M2VXL7_TRAPU|nr:hypothetical protein TRAPUB_11129 [Trametes pubescens]
MEQSLEAIGKEFDINFFEKRKWDGVRGTVSRTWKVATSIAHRRSQARTPTARPSQPRWRLPLELLEQIIDHLHNDVPTLRSCALICNALVASAQYYLFNRIVIKAENFVNAVLLFVKNPHLTGHVRELYFEAGEGTAFESLQALLEGKGPPKYLRVFALVIAPRLSNVVRLAFKDVPFDQHIVAMFASSFPRIYMLSLFDCWFRCNADLDTLVKGHPLIHTLRCGRLCSRYGASDQDFAEQPGSRLTLRSLKVTESYSPTPLTLLPWLVTHVESETFIYSLYRLSQVAKLNQIIAGYASLRHLHIVLPRWRKEDTREVAECPPVVAIVPHYPPNLVTLTVDAKLHSLFLGAHILAQLDPHAFVRLSTVNIIAHITVPDIEEVELDAWAGMDQTLSVLLSLGAVNFINNCNDTSHVEAGSAAIIKRLPVLNVRKVLSFVAQRPPK